MRINVTPNQVKKLLEDMGRIIVGKMVLADELSDDELGAVTDLFQPWAVGENITEKMVKKGTLRGYNDKIYKCTLAHVTQADWTPDITPNLWVVKTAPGIIPEWTQPESNNPFNNGDKVTYNGRLYESSINNNVWSPVAYPAGWTDLGAA